jgi:hypothetical protein
MERQLKTPSRRWATAMTARRMATARNAPMIRSMSRRSSIRVGATSTKAT